MKHAAVAWHALSHVANDDGEAAAAVVVVSLLINPGYHLNLPYYLYVYLCHLLLPNRDYLRVGQDVNYDDEDDDDAAAGVAVHLMDLLVMWAIA